MDPFARIDAIYRRLPDIQCKKLCTESCGPILMSRLEWQRIIKRLGYEPKMERLLDPCPMLNQTSGLCTVYHIRPLICRLWGIVRKMRCPFGCAPAEYMEDGAADKLFDEIAKINAEEK